MNEAKNNHIETFDEISPAKGKKMIAVVSGGQNMGKTFFAYNLCHALSLFKKKIIFFD